MEGKVLAQYRVIERMGGGGMGAVFRAFDETLDREVALKIIAADVDDPEKRFRAEAVAIARLNHPNISAVYELFQHDGQWVMVMELVRGETLEQILERVGTLSPKRAAELCMQVLVALSHAHQMGVVHRDLKPSNVMVTENGALKLMDFGIARVEGTERLTNDGFMMGTPAYMAPEQVIGHAIDGRADLYALGIVFYRLLSGKLPFKGDSPYEMAQAQVRDQPIPIDLYRPDLPVWVKYILDLALAKSADQRFQSADEFHAAFAAALAETTTTASRMVMRTEQMPRPTSGQLARPRPASGPLPRPISASVPRPPATSSTGRRPTASTARLKQARARRVAAWSIVATMASAIVVASVSWSHDSPVVPAEATAPSNVVAPRTESASRGSGAAAPIAAGAAKPVTAPTAGRRGKAADVSAATAPTLVAAFGLRLLVVDGQKTSERDVVLGLTNLSFSIGPTDGGAPLWTVPYKRVEKATYVFAQAPRWDPALSGPGEKIEFSGRARHWLALQTADAYAILRLDGGGWQRAIDAFEVASGRRIDRPASNEK